VLEADRRIAALTGLDLFGSNFLHHCTLTGQRTWTVMIHLNEPIAGGATRFKAINKLVRPETGKLLSGTTFCLMGG
jgi:hypothetical protein